MGTPEMSFEDSDERPSWQQPVTLPADPRLKERLAAKVAEYQTRVEERQIRLENVGEYTAPEEARRREREFARAETKRSILQQLLDSGKIDYDKERQRLRGMPGFTDEAFNNAYAVISDYANTGGEFTVRGTGLKWSESNQHQAE